jgi:PAS domain S-box-containing protein
LIETLTILGDRLQIAIVIGSVPTDGSGDIVILYANDRTADIFGYDSGADMKDLEVRSLMTPDIARVHQGHVGGYLIRAQSRNGASLAQKSGRVMGSWRNLKGVRLDGSTTDIQANVADIKNDVERYFIAVFRDRTDDVQREQELQEALEKANQSKEEIEGAMKQTELAKAEAEAALRRQETLRSDQVNLLLENLSERKSGTQVVDRRSLGTGFDRRQLFVGLLFLLIFLAGACVLYGEINPGGVAVLERVLLVLSGAAAALTSGIIDPRNKA